MPGTATITRALTDRQDVIVAWLYGSRARGNAQGAVERLYEHTGLTDPSAGDLRGAVGMRNAIIQDDLNLDWRLLEAVLRDARERQIERLVRELGRRLLAGS